MSSKARNAEKRLENEEAYEREVRNRSAKKQQYQDQFAGLLTKLECLGINDWELLDWIKYVTENGIP